MRLAIVGSPRSGNSWSRSVLAETLGLEELAYHNWLDIGPLPDHCIVQIHWYREPNFQAFLEQNGFQIITLARHPLDILLSVLAFVRHEPETRRWLGGNGAIPREMIGEDPASPVFLRWASGFGAENLLSVSYQWWHDPQAIRCRYEDLIADPKRSFSAMTQSLGGTAERLDDALRSLTLAKYQASPNRHGWQGRAGLWTELIDGANAARLAERHARVFEALGYATDNGVPIGDEAVRRRWRELDRPPAA